MINPKDFTPELYAAVTLSIATLRAAADKARREGDILLKVHAEDEYRRLEGDRHMLEHFNRFQAEERRLKGNAARASLWRLRRPSLSSRAAANRNFRRAKR
ncbi:MAG TPA: hypothetical protein VF614_03335 [Chthoniobacteraceae bacterium]|jgi:hypothetical protein